MPPTTPFRRKPLMALRFVRSIFLMIVGFIATQIAHRGSAEAEQIVARHIEYSNDSISDHGKTVACIVTLVVASPPDPRTLNFQFLSFKGTAGWKITGGRMDWNTQSMTAMRAQDGSFSSSTFVVPKAFQKNLTPEGQLVGVLIQPEQLSAFIEAFFKEPYTVAVTWQGSPDELTYYVAASPSADVKGKFITCMKTL